MFKFIYEAVSDILNQLSPHLRNVRSVGSRHQSCVTVIRGTAEQTVYRGSVDLVLVKIRTSVIVRDGQVPDVVALVFRATS